MNTLTPNTTLVKATLSYSESYVGITYSVPTFKFKETK